MAVALTFDDLNVANWLDARALFDDANARVTFCVSHLHTATPEQIAGLQTLQSDGHEIAFHTRTHPKLTSYLDAHGLDHYMAHEVDAGVAEHRALGFPATAFACPFHASTPETREALATRFRVVRTGGPRGARKNALQDRIYDKPGPDRSVDNIGFCDFQHRAFRGWSWQNLVLDAIADHGGTGVFAGHDIHPDRSGNGFYSSHRQIRRFLRAVSRRGLNFCTLSEIAD